MNFDTVENTVQNVVYLLAAANTISYSYLMDFDLLSNIHHRGIS